MISQPYAYVHSSSGKFAKPSSDSSDDGCSTSSSDSDTEAPPCVRPTIPKSGTEPCPLSDNVQVMASDNSNNKSKNGVPSVFRASCTERYTLFPIRNHNLWKLYKRHQANFWTAEEIDLTLDIADWNKLNDGEKHFLKTVLAFFAASDGIVLENLVERFCCEVELPEARCFYGFQAMMENIHSETYSLLIDTYVKDKAERMRLFHAIEEIPSVRQKAEWALRWIGSEKGFVERLVAFAAVEGIFFSGSFCAVFWMKKRGLMQGFTFSNELIARDEGMHCEFACVLYAMLADEQRLDDSVVYEIIEGAVSCEREFVCEALSIDLIGMNKQLMAQYIEFVADRLLLSLGYDRLYKSKNPFEWMELISLQGKTNFFERRVSEYAKANFNTESGEGRNIDHDTFRLDIDF